VNNDLHTNQEDKVPIKIQSKNLACFSFYFISFACGAVFSQMNFACGAFLFTKILSMGHFISVSSLVYQFISIGKDSNSKTQ